MASGNRDINGGRPHPVRPFDLLSNAPGMRRPDFRMRVSNSIKAEMNSYNNVRLAFEQNNRSNSRHVPSANTSVRQSKPADISNPQVIEYLMKKGYVRTEQVLRQESAQVDKDGRPVFDREEYGNEKYIKGFELLSSWIDSNLDIYKVSSRECWRSCNANSV